MKRNEKKKEQSEQEQEAVSEWHSLFSRAGLLCIFLLVV